jgi:hypothetical protein
MSIGITEGVFMGKQKVEMKELLAVFAESGSYSKTAKQVGLDMAGIHRRICRYLDKNIGCPWREVVIRERVRQVIQEMEVEGE